MSLGFNIYDVQFNAVGMKIMEPCRCQNIPPRTCGTFANVTTTTTSQATDNFYNIDLSQDKNVSLEFKFENYNSVVPNRVNDKTNKEKSINARFDTIDFKLQSYLRQRCLHKNKLKSFLEHNCRAFKTQGHRHQSHSKHWHTQNLICAE